MSAKNISFILHKPQLSENIGACARGMKNFNFEKLIVISPKPIFPNDKILATSVGAKNIINKSKVFNHLESAVKNIDYVIAHTYEPDFVRKFDDGRVILIEAKGRFWDFAEYSKYIHIKKALPKHIELVFFFQKPFAPMPGAKVRRDKTKRTHAEWAEKNNFRWFDELTLPEEWKE